MTLEKLQQLKSLLNQLKTEQLKEINHLDRNYWGSDIPTIVALLHLVEHYIKVKAKKK